MANQNITNLADPVNAQDAATKAYVDALLKRIEKLEKADKSTSNMSDFTIQKIPVYQYNDVTSIAIDAQGNKWFGMNSGEVVKFDNVNWTVYDSY